MWASAKEGTLWFMLGKRLHTHTHTHSLSLSLSLNGEVTNKAWEIWGYVLDSQEVEIWELSHGCVSTEYSVEYSVHR